MLFDSNFTKIDTHLDNCRLQLENSNIAQYNWKLPPQSREDRGRLRKYNSRGGMGGRSGLIS